MGAPRRGVEVVMSLALFLLMLSLPLGVLTGAGPAWPRAWPSLAELGAPASGPPSPTAWPIAADSSDHPSTCLAVATLRARAYLGFIAKRWHLEDLDPITWLVAGRLRDRFETSVLAAMGAVQDWLGAQPCPAGPDPRAQLEREGIRETMAELVGTLPTFPVDLGRECHYRVSELERICRQLCSLAAGVDRHRQAADHPPPSPYR
jgi:hypothetical protein